MSRSSGVQVKKRWLGDVYPGQALCHCRIDITQDRVMVSTLKDGFEVSSRDVTGDAAARFIYKLREFVRAGLGGGRWRITSHAPGTAVLETWYPSRRWYTRRQQLWLALDFGSV